jgi:alcohol dehydrogenase YqhD (iron-dependent ADH family)
VKEKHFEAVVAVGGGSVLDSAKAIAAGAKYEGDVWDFFISKAVVQDALSVFSVMTLAATGSEMNAYGVITNDETRQKYSIYSPLLYPKVSVINPDLMATFRMPTWPIPRWISSPTCSTSTLPPIIYPNTTRA